MFGHENDEILQLSEIPFYHLETLIIPFATEIL